MDELCHNIAQMCFIVFLNVCTAMYLYWIEKNYLIIIIDEDENIRSR